MIFHLKNCIYFFLIFFVINNQLVEAHENKYLNKTMQQQTKLEDFYSNSQINYSEHDKVDNQLNMFFGFNPENPGYSYYPDELIISDSDYVRDIYKSKLKEMTINKINYKIER